MIKNKPPFPFETVALAIAFSPRLEALLCEAKSMAELCGAKLILIHVGKRTSEKDQQLNELFEKHNFQKIQHFVFFEEGDPVDTILSICKNNVVDLLMVGALEKENPLKYYQSSITLEICRRAKCSVLLLIEPRVQPLPFTKIVVDGSVHSKTINTVNTALYIADKEKLKNISVLIQSQINEPSGGIGLSETEMEKPEGQYELRSHENFNKGKFLDERIHKEIKVDIVNMEETNGASINEYSHHADAGLVVVNSPDHHMAIFDRIFSDELEFMLSDLSCNMLVVHSRVH